MTILMIGIGIWIVLIVCVFYFVSRGISQAELNSGSLCPDCGGELIDNVYYAGGAGSAMPVKDGKKCPVCGFRKTSKQQKEEERSMEDKIIRIIKDQLCVKEVKIEDSIIDDLGADSLDSIELMIAFEEEFDIDISDDEARENIRVYEIVDLVQEKLEKKGIGHVAV